MYIEHATDSRVTLYQARSITEPQLAKTDVYT
jgi:hypothetical protein